MEKICVEINGAFYESLCCAGRHVDITDTSIKRRCLSDKYSNYKIVPFRVVYIKKKCTKCGKIKLLEEFGVERTGKDGLKTECKQCTRERVKKWRKDNIEHCKKRDKEYRNRRDVKDRANKRAREARKTDVMIRINHNISKGIWKSLKGGKNGAHWETLVGYTLEEFRAHFEKQFLPGMTWENYGEWEIDHHPIPLYWFVFEKTTDKGFQKAWALESLRPAWSKLNRTKGKKLFHP